MPALLPSRYNRRNRLPLGTLDGTPALVLERQQLKEKVESRARTAASVTKPRAGTQRLSQQQQQQQQQQQEASQPRAQQQQQYRPATSTPASSTSSSANDPQVSSAAALRRRHQQQYEEQVHHQRLEAQELELQRRQLQQQRERPFAPLPMHPQGQQQPAGSQRRKQEQKTRRKQQTPHRHVPNFYHMPNLQHANHQQQHGPRHHDTPHWDASAGDAGVRAAGGQQRQQRQQHHSPGPHRSSSGTGRNMPFAWQSVDTGPATATQESPSTSPRRQLSPRVAGAASASARRAQQRAVGAGEGGRTGTHRASSLPLHGGGWQQQRQPRQQTDHRHRLHHRRSGSREAGGRGGGRGGGGDVPPASGHRRSRSHGAANVTRLNAAAMAAANAEGAAAMAEACAEGEAGPGGGHGVGGGGEAGGGGGGGGGDGVPPSYSASAPVTSRVHAASIKARQEAERRRRRRQRRLLLIRKEVSKAAAAIGGMNNFMGKFHDHDRNHDGSVDYHEFRALCHAVMPGLPLSEVEFLIESIDPKGKGYIFDLRFFQFIEQHLHLHTKRVLIDERRPEPASINTTAALLKSNPARAKASTAQALSSTGSRYRSCVRDAVHHVLSKKELAKAPQQRRHQFDTWIRANTTNIDSVTK